MCSGRSTLQSVCPSSQASSQAVDGVTGRFLDKIRADKEIQRINRCHTAAAVLEIHHVAADPVVILATYLSKGVQVHRLMTDNSDADSAFARLTAAYLHFTEGDPWYFGRRDEVHEIDPHENFAVFQEVAATIPAWEAGELAEVSRLRAQCAELAERHRSQGR
jgi:hypothetical protein